MILPTVRFTLATKKLAEEITKKNIEEMNSTIDKANEKEEDSDNEKENLAG